MVVWFGQQYVFGIGFVGHSGGGDLRRKDWRKEPAVFCSGTDSVFCKSVYQGDTGTENDWQIAVERSPTNEVRNGRGHPFLLGMVIIATLFHFVFGFRQDYLVARNTL